MNFLGSVGGVGGARGLLELSSRWWRGELGMGSRRLGGGRGEVSGVCPVPVPTTPKPIPAASRALRLGELLNLLAAAFSFFFFCYTETENRRGTGVKTGTLKENIKMREGGKPNGAQGGPEQGCPNFLQSGINCDVTSSHFVMNSVG